MRISVQIVTLVIIGSVNTGDVVAQLHHQDTARRSDRFQTPIRGSRLPVADSSTSVRQASGCADGCRCRGSENAWPQGIPATGSASGGPGIPQLYGTAPQPAWDYQYPRPAEDWRSNNMSTPMDLNPWEAEDARFDGQDRLNSEYSNRSRGQESVADKDYRAGDYPFLFGDVFGVGKFDCCDEWADHCPCLEKTNSLSVCDCTNPHRTRQSAYAGYYYRERSGRRGVPVERRPDSEENPYRHHIRNQPSPGYRR